MKSLPFSCLCAACCNHIGIMTRSTAGAEANLPCLSVKLSLEPDLLWRALLQLWGCALLLWPILFLTSETLHFALAHARLCCRGSPFGRGVGTGSWDNFALNPCAKACQGLVVWWEEDLGGSMTVPWALTSPAVWKTNLFSLECCLKTLSPSFF